MRTTHPKLLTAPKVPKKKKKKQKDEWNKLPDVSDDEDPALKPRWILDDPKRLQAAVTSAMKKVDGDWFQWLTSFMPLTGLLAPPCSAEKYTFLNDLLLRHAQPMNSATCAAF
uniref:Uncharacterized protein n=1 Tax=Romanomermis culicivorax TaxID=13658 RepID=A0A915IVT4_ROMCU